MFLQLADTVRLQVSKRTTWSMETDEAADKSVVVRRSR